MTEQTKTPIPADMAIAILQGTNDGEDLSPIDLKLVEMAVNGWLNEAGEVAFYNLYSRVQNGYKPQWLNGIAPFTVDHEGYIYYKGINVEHYDYPYSIRAKRSLLELRTRCKYLEWAGVNVSTTACIWSWEKYAPPGWDEKESSRLFWEDEELYKQERDHDNN